MLCMYFVSMWQMKKKEITFIMCNDTLAGGGFRMCQLIVCRALQELASHYPALCFSFLSNMPSLETSLLNTRMPITILTWKHTKLYNKGLSYPVSIINISSLLISWNQ